ncbi:hypothetical protein NEUTE1DRAFT_101137 [Neurospora tetrasperma FGSC 2508]|uniref:Uncharacterized protein n=1 Tax=Neurospora tetrasperma (strain FGSC 2508 / ATCC MYA-4615 / P0657) TaxID=510951 RepID=F8MKP1_NEUT8|nr:uncharacterized protein NEUTE1DRAFT_101137 [Neurospora tetrasperma FGSC 2508]EGO58269.1 hypothetical protein NEUTE1DRAFT_101137 [Neurospora tetrasperma FGSC 2508]EGZ71414.1 hypothetical protein NEUTE2DRAFT_128805 [Neurospora tetrasperma FGSC 2509]
MKLKEKSSSISMTGKSRLVITQTPDFISAICKSNTTPPTISTQNGSSTRARDSSWPVHVAVRSMVLAMSRKSQRPFVGITAGTASTGKTNSPIIRIALISDSSPTASRSGGLSP